jgi:hypothetical protein
LYGRDISTRNARRVKNCVFTRNEAMGDSDAPMMRAANAKSPPSWEGGLFDHRMPISA